VHVLIDLASRIHFQLSNSTDSTTPPTLALPTGLNLEYLSLNSLSVKVVTGCLQQSLWPPNFCESHIGKHHILVSSFNPHLILILEPQKIIIPFLILINPHSGTSKNPHSTSKPHSGTWPNPHVSFHTHSGTGPTSWTSWNSHSSGNPHSWIFEHPTHFLYPGTSPNFHSWLNPDSEIS
jgi:hypothetical protein